MFFGAFYFVSVEFEQSLFYDGVQGKSTVFDNGVRWV